MAKTITVLVPTAKTMVEEIASAPRIRDLNGKVVGFLWNDKPNGDILLHRIKEQLSQRFRLAGTIWQRQHIGPTVDGAIIEELARNSDVVINAVAD